MSWKKGNYEPKIVIIGAGPCGLGAAFRLEEVGYSNYLLLEQGSAPGGLAGSTSDQNGFYWDHGGHVTVSHYDYFDDLLDLANKDWIRRDHEAWVWMRGKFIPYPFENHIHCLPSEDLWECVKGLMDKREVERPDNFSEWLEGRFGKGIMDVFLEPYNRKAWGYKPSDMNAEWVDKGVASVDIERVLHNLVMKSDDLPTKPNSSFRFPLKGGSATIWNGVYNLLQHKQNVRFDSKVVHVDADEKRVGLDDGEWIPYDFLISTMPLDILCSSISGRHFVHFPQYTPQFRYSSTHIVGLGMADPCPSRLKTKCCMYFPESDCPFNCATVFSNCTPYNVPHPGEEWSMTFQVCETPMRPVDHNTIIQDVIDGAIATELITPTSKILSKYYRKIQRGYPTPFNHRDKLCKPIFDTLEKHAIYSRGSFGAWKYEVSNQDHTMMQGVEVVDHILFETQEYTFRWPEVVNRPEWKHAGRKPSLQHEDSVTYHDPHQIIAQILATSAKQKNHEITHVKVPLTILIDMDNCLADWESQFERKMTQHYPQIPLLPRSQRTNWCHVLDYPEQHQKEVQEVCGTPGFFRDMPPNPNAIDALRDMNKEGYRVFIVSAPDPNHYASCCMEKCEWIVNHLGADWLPRLILTRDKTMVRGDILIDDKPTCMYGSVEPTWEHVLYTQTYNEGLEGKRLSDWANWRTVVDDTIS